MTLSQPPKLALTTSTKSSESARWKRSVTSWPTSTNSFEGSKRLKMVPAEHSCKHYFEDSED